MGGYWRTLIRIDYVVGENVLGVIPAWDTGVWIYIPIKSLPKQIYDRIKNGENNFHLKADLSKDEPTEILETFCEWEID